VTYLTSLPLCLMTKQHTVCLCS